MDNFVENLPGVAAVLYPLTLAAAIGTMIFAWQVGSSGGEIRHSEIRSGAVAAGVAEPNGGGENAHDDDD